MSVALSFSGYRHRKRLVRSAVDWYVSNFLGKYQLEIDIEDRGLNREGLYGACTVLDRNSRPREFLIEMNNTLDDMAYLSTLFHELIHVKQRVLGQFKTKYEKDYWFGKLIDPDTEYKNLPWEVEAHQYEGSVTELYLESLATAL